MYMLPIKAAMGTQNEIISEEDYAKLFPNVEIIVNLNSELLSALQERIESWSPHQKIGDVFCKRVRTCILYSYTLLTACHCLGTIV